MVTAPRKRDKIKISKFVGEEKWPNSCALMCLRLSCHI